MSSSDLEEDSDSPPLIENLNISNDKYYEPISESQPLTTSSSSKYLRDSFSNIRSRLQIPNYGLKKLQHSLPAYDLWRPFFPTYLGAEKFKDFHRPKLRHFNTGPQSCYKKKRFRAFPIKNLAKTLYKYQLKLRRNVIEAIEAGLPAEDIINRFFKIYTAKQLTAKNGELYLFEYCEEYPSVLSQIGMASTLETYSSDPPKSKRIYFNKLKPGTKIHVIENNLYRAPIYQHQTPSYDFLIIRTRNSFYVRPIQTIYSVGQTMPLEEIPGPKCSDITTFRSSLTNFYIHKMFMESTEEDPSINLDIFMKLFPDYHRDILRTRMKKKGAIYDPITHKVMRGTSNYGSHSRAALRSMLTPEKYCRYMSMLAARERLKELNYTDTMIDPPKSGPVETEVLAAPWNTSSALINAMKGNHYLDFKKHLIDPTGSRHEGYSCVPWIKSPTEESYRENINPNDPMANLAAKNVILGKIRREKLERLAIFESEAQHITDMQARALESQEILSSDEDDDLESDSEQDEKFNEQVNDLNRLVNQEYSKNQLDHEKEEELRKQMLEELGPSSDKSRPGKVNGIHTKGSTPSSQDLFDNKILKITRTYLVDAKIIERTEIVRDTRVIALYIKQQQQPEGLSTSMNGCSELDISRYSTRSPKLNSSSRSLNRSRSDSLGPSELCRAEGTVVRISKKVLDARNLRQIERSCRKDEGDS